MDRQTIEEGKTIAIIGYLTFIGMIVAYFMNMNKHNEFASFHIRQSLGLVILFVLVSFLRSYLSIGFLGNLMVFVVIILRFVGFMNAAKGAWATIPIFGEYFEKALKFVR